MSDGLGSGDATLRLAVAQLRSGQLERAEESFRKALAAQSASLEARQGLALTLQAAGRIPEAFAAWSSALELDPEDRMSLTNHALLAIRRGDLAAAAADLEVLGQQGPAAAPGIQRIRLELEAREKAAGDAGKAEGGNPKEDDDGLR